MTDELNIASRHRHAKGWKLSEGEELPPPDRRAIRWTVVGLVAFWAAVLWLVWR